MHVAVAQPARVDYEFVLRAERVTVRCWCVLAGIQAARRRAMVWWWRGLSADRHELPLPTHRGNDRLLAQGIFDR